MMFEENPQVAPHRRSLLAPPARPLTRAEAIFWNERELRAGWRLAIFALIVFVINLGGSKLTIALHLPKFTSSNFTLRGMLFQESVRFLAVLLATAIMGFLEGRPLGGYGLPRDGAFRARFWQGVAWGIAMITMVLLLIRAFGGFSFGEFVLRGSAIWRYAALWGVGFVLVGFFEEYQFRGYPQFTLATGMGFWPAASVLSAVFGAVHLLNPGEDKIGALSVFVIAMFFCLTLRRTGSLWFAVGLHAAFDWGETFLYSVPDSGLVAPGHLLNSSFHGAAWLTGGSVGPEGSVMAFAVVGLAALIFARVYPSRTGFSLSGLPNQTADKPN
ncbi:MAG TPA: type II CAAX endopeptidase family protein [Candidatus Acidoferrales bacterium]|nr:type II CAAX endopeptidase family protein [Candidatus Acidoferrales bacterium]